MMITTFTTATTTEQQLESQWPQVIGKENPSKPQKRRKTKGKFKRGLSIFLIMSGNDH